MSEDQKKQLQTQLWNIANELRGKMGADEFRDYILGFIFYKYLSEKLTLFADEILEADNRLYKDLDERVAEDASIIEAVRKDAIDSLGFFLKPVELFGYVAEHGSKNGNLIEQLEKTLNSVEQSTLGADSQDDFDKLFSELDLNANKLGKTVHARSELISRVLVHLDKIDFRLEDSKVDILGDAYEYLISQFASGAGKKAGEFYTPQEVSTVLAKIVTAGKKKIKSVYDPTCGSGSLLLRVARQVDEVGMFYGQEMNNTTYNLARMNMILHDVNFSKFDIRQEDTLEHPQHAEYRFEAIVANPPFSAKWSSNPIHMSDDRFSQYGVLAPTKPADYAFIQHMIYQLDDNGTMAVVMPHGALYRRKSEEKIRKHLVFEKNYLDAIIGLPINIFYGTDTPTCVMVFKKCRTSPDDVLFIDASQDFEKGTQNRLREIDIERITKAYESRITEKKYSYLAPIKEIQANNCDLNIAKYVDTSIEQPVINLAEASEKLEESERAMDDMNSSIKDYCALLGIPEPKGNNLPLLKDYKSGVMQDIFSGKIRFTKSGVNYPTWKEYKLKDLLSERKHRNSKNEYTEVFSVAKNKGVINQIEHLGRSYSSDNISNYKVVHPDDVIYTKSPTKDYPYGIIKQNKLDRYGVVSVLYAVYKPGSKTIGSVLDHYFSNWINTYNYLNPLIHKGAKNTMNIGNDDFLNGKTISLPVDEDEFAKISDFLSSLDNKIKLLEDDSRAISLD